VVIDVTEAWLTTSACPTASGTMFAIPDFIPMLPFIMHLAFTWEQLSNNRADVLA
jgi:hypothetical protein